MDRQPLLAHMPNTGATGQHLSEPGLGLGRKDGREGGRTDVLIALLH